jgi:hypothetical protein
MFWYVAQAGWETNRQTGHFSGENLDINYRDA